MGGVDKHRLWFFLFVFLLAYSISDADHALRSARWNTPADSLIFAGRYLFYFLMGMWLSRFGFGKNNLRGIGIILLAGIPLWLLAYDPDGWDQPFAYPIWAFLALWAVYRFVSEKGWAKLPIGLIASIGRYSLMIYMIHQIVIYDLLWPLQNVIPLSGWMRADLIVLAAVAISLVVGKLLMDAYSRICIWGQALILPR